MLNRATEAQRNRALMPEFSALVDELRAVFGPVRVVWASENGHVVGRPPAGMPDEKKEGAAS